ncbi:MAG: DUF1573 domain-containing protein [Planctomycetota bacterium]|nr:DUF1573 domain-containing protein [Planctomycetota bacterium]
MGLCTAYVLWGGAALPPPAPAPPVEPPARPQTNPGQNINTAPAPAPAAKPVIPTGPPSALKIVPADVDFGEVLVNESREKVTLIENPTAQDITITTIRGNCACLKMDQPPKKIPAGKTEEFKITFIGQSGRRPESYVVTMTTDEPENLHATMVVRGKVKQVFFVEPQTLYFDQVAKNQSKTMEATIKHAEGKPFTVKSVSASNKEFTFKWEPLPDGSGYKILATVLSARTGAITEGAAILTDHPVVPVMPLHVSVRVTGDVVSNTLVLTAKQDADHRVGAFQTGLKRLTPGRLVVEKVTEDKGTALEYNVERIDDSNAKLTIQFKDVFARDQPFGEFVVQTNAEAQPLRIPFRVIRPGPRTIADPNRPPQRVPPRP